MTIVIKQEKNLEDITKIANECFSNMIKLYSPADKLNVTKPFEDYNFYVIDYISKLYSSKRQETGLLLEFYIKNKRVHYGFTRVNKEYRNKGFGTELTMAREEILKRLGFRTSLIPDPLEESYLFWEKIGYTFDPKKHQFRKQLF